MESRLLRSAALLARAARLARAAATSTGRAVTAEHLAEVVASAAGDRGFPSGALRQAALALARSSAPEARPRATAEVVRAAAMVFRAAQEAGSPGVAEVAGDLAHAAHDCVRALVESGPAAERPRCLLRLWRRKNRHNKNAAGEADLEAPLLHPHERPSSSSSPIGASLSEIITMYIKSHKEPYLIQIQTILALLMHMTFCGLKSAYSPLSPSTFHIIFCTWWICVGLDVLCGNRGRAMMKNILAFILAFYARASARLAILGVSLLVILYSHLELAPNEIYTLYILLGAATCMHLLVWAMDYMSRAPGDAAD
ncbi:hypothetical protein DAI22_01g434700 [Oryza sativa Japonica Group]|nr:hypothetical protein DAI22_01g434700 [Oryza sativa Japonica Group]